MPTGVHRGYRGHAMGVRTQRVPSGSAGAVHVGGCGGRQTGGQPPPHDGAVAEEEEQQEDRE
jgi:hypothetical protein